MVQELHQSLEDLPLRNERHHVTLLVVFVLQAQNLYLSPGVLVYLHSGMIEMLDCLRFCADPLMMVGEVR